MTEKPKRRWFQFSLRALLAFVLLASIGMSWLMVRKQRVRRQREAIAAIETLGGYVEYKEGETPLWLRELLGDDFFFVEVHRAGIDGTLATEAVLEHLEGLTNLRSLDLHGTQVTDAGVNELRKALPNCDIRRQPRAAANTLDKAPRTDSNPILATKPAKRPKASGQLRSPVQ